MLPILPWEQIVLLPGLGFLCVHRQPSLPGFYLEWEGSVALLFPSSLPAYAGCVINFPSVAEQDPKTKTRHVYMMRPENLPVILTTLSPHV